MPYIKLETTGLSSISTVAKLVNMDTSGFWRQVYESKSIPEPTRLIGHRRFYTAKQVENVIAIVNKLRQAGRIR